MPHWPAGTTARWPDPDNVALAAYRVEALRRYELLTEAQRALLDQMWPQGVPTVDEWRAMLQITARWLRETPCP